MRARMKHTHLRLGALAIAAALMVPVSGPVLAVPSPVLTSSPAVVSAPPVRGAAPLRGAVVATPPGAPEPRVRFPTLQPLAVGTGAHVLVSPIPTAVWALMQRATWSPGCVPRASLRYLTVNYWGFDGVRYRGEMVVRSDVAAKVAQVLTLMYDTRYPVRLMALPDHFGRTPGGYPGANDYAQMAADNTSAFNCRYADGAEATHRWSLHAQGRTLDINPFENPDSTGRPDSWYLVHRTPSNRAVLFSSSAVTRAFTSRGWFWGGLWRGTVDYQHFEPA